MLEPLIGQYIAWRLPRFCTAPCRAWARGPRPGGQVRVFGQWRSRQSSEHAEKRTSPRPARERLAHATPADWTQWRLLLGLNQRIKALRVGPRHGVALSEHPKEGPFHDTCRKRIAQRRPRTAGLGGSTSHASSAESSCRARELVKLCYTLVHAAEAVGIRDLADGEYLPTDKTLEEGIERQLNYLLDQVGCNRPGFRLLEIGCGYGHLLRLAKERGAHAVGVNLSPEQVKYCNDNGLQVYCCNYRDLLEATEWHGQFDGVIANGSLEHWVQPEDVQAGRMNPIYHESFAIAHRVLDPSASEARYVTTAIHVKREVKPEYLLTPWYRQPRGSDRRHFSLLHHWMGGYYPVDGQLEECAQAVFLAGSGNGWDAGL